MSFKLLLFVALSVAVATANVIPASSNLELLDNVIRANSNNLVVGQRQYNDRLVYQESISISASLIGKKVIHEQTFNTTKNHVITQALALDQATDGTGATATVIGGGPGLDYIKLRFKSQRFHGIYFTIQLYAKPRY